MESRELKSLCKYNKQSEHFKETCYAFKKKNAHKSVTTIVADP